MEAFGRPLEYRGYGVVNVTVVLSIIGIIISTAVPAYRLFIDTSPTASVLLVE